MNKLLIKGGYSLSGEIEISGSKNAALPLMVASLLTDETLELANIPHLADISTMANLLTSLGVMMHMDGSISHDGYAGRILKLNASNITSNCASYELVSKMRASILVLGPLLARFGQARVSLPGGCAIGSRPVDLHLKAIEKMGAEIELDNGYVNACVKNGRLHGAEIVFEKASVGATENLMMAATLAYGETILHNAAREPEVCDLAHCLIKMGAQIEGTGSDKIIITGVERLSAATHTILPDRIEAATYALAIAGAGGDVELVGITMDLIEAVVIKMREAGAVLTQTDRGIRVTRTASKLKPVNFMTEPHPGFPTDAQAQMMAMLTLADGASHITETIFENRMMHVQELARLGADIKISGANAVVNGVSCLLGAEVTASDLRASASLVIAGLIASGETIINHIHHLDRGYERIEEKLLKCGAQIERIR